jgi:hypothetical protein
VTLKCCPIPDLFNTFRHCSHWYRSKRLKSCHWGWRGSRCLRCKWWYKWSWDRMRTLQSGTGQVLFILGLKKSDTAVPAKHHMHVQVWESKNARSHRNQLQETDCLHIDGEWSCYGVRCVRKTLPLTSVGPHAFFRRKTTATSLGLQVRRVSSW